MIINPSAQSLYLTLKSKINTKRRTHFQVFENNVKVYYYTNYYALCIRVNDENTYSLHVFWENTVITFGPIDL